MELFTQIICEILIKFRILAQIKYLNFKTQQKIQ